MKIIEMWNINGHQLNLGYVPYSDAGISIWEQDEYTFGGYKDSKLYLYQNILGLQFVDKDIQNNIEYIDQFMNTAYLRGDNVNMTLSDLTMDCSSPKEALIALRENEDTIYSFLFVCYIWLKFNKSEKTIEFHRFGDDTALWNGVIRTTYIDGKLQATYEEYFKGMDDRSKDELQVCTGTISLEDIKIMIRMEPRDATIYLLDLLGVKSN